MYRSCLLFTTALSIGLQSTAYANQSLSCDTSHTDILKEVGKRLEMTTTSIPLPVLNGFVHHFQSFQSYQKHPHFDYSCHRGHYSEKERFYSRMRIKETGKVISCVNTGLTNDMRDIGLIEGKWRAYPMLYKTEYLFSKTDKWSELEPWLIQKDGKTHWQGGRSFSVVRVLEPETPFEDPVLEATGNKYGKISFVYDHSQDPISAHWNKVPSKERRKAEIVYICDRFTDSLKFHSMRYGNINGVHLNKYFNLNWK